jgi:hypothetical protein
MYRPANDNTDPQHQQRVLRIAETLDQLARSTHPRLAIRMIHVAAEKAVRDSGE